MVSRLTRNEKIAGSTPALGISVAFSFARFVSMSIGIYDGAECMGGR